MPATMKMLEEWNWYLPSWLRWLPSLTPEPQLDAEPAPDHQPSPALR